MMKYTAKKYTPQFESIIKEMARDEIPLCIIGTLFLKMAVRSFELDLMSQDDIKAIRKKMEKKLRGLEKKKK